MPAARDVNPYVGVEPPAYSYRLDSKSEDVLTGQLGRPNARNFSVIP